MSKEDELLISNYFGKYFSKKFENSKYNLNWGQVDDWLKLKENSFLFLEIETSQKHPNTNVLKIWPFLEENKEIRIFLIQSFFTDSTCMNSSRGLLGEWTGKQLEKMYPNRFKYYKVVFKKEKIELSSNKLKEDLQKFID